ncbi:MAG: MFS transporter [Methanomicrobiaceae archaeon]|nr:MFS transporter [Methanomicrobiaceae archaeon]
MTGLAVFAIYFTISSVTLANPMISHIFHIGAREMGLVIQAHLLGAIMFLIPAGRLGDRYGHIRIFTCGSIIFAISSLLCGLSDSGIQIIFFRFIQGTGDGMMIATSLVLLTRTFGEKERGKALGFFLFAGYTGYVCGMIPGGLAVWFIGWQSIFFLTVPVTLAAGIIAFRLGKNMNSVTDKTDKKFDLIGMLIFCPAIILVTAGISDLLSFNARINLISGILILALFMMWEKKAKNPLFKPGIFRENRLFTFSILADLLYYITTGCIVFTLSIYLENGLLCSAFLAGIILIPSSLIQGAVSPYAGHLSDKIEPRYVTAAGMLLIVATLLFYSKAGVVGSVTAISIMLAITGSGLALFSSPNKNAVMSSVKKEFQGEASGIANTFEQTGNIISISMAALIITVFAGTSEITSENLPEFIESMHVIFLSMAVLGIITAIVCLKRGNLR